jgi:hypothetical protein
LVKILYSHFKNPLQNFIYYRRKVNQVRQACHAIPAIIPCPPLHPSWIVEE